MTFDEQVAALRGKVPPKHVHKRKADCTPEEWAAKLDYLQRWQFTNRHKHRAYVQKWKDRNRERHRVQQRHYLRNKRASDVQFRLRGALSCRVNDALRRVLQGKGVRPETTMQLVGCAMPELMRHLESQFQSGMTWGNWGLGPGKWHIDHVVPCAKMDLTNDLHRRMVFHYTNLRPMWEPENLHKSASVSWADVYSHLKKGSRKQ
jgi:hypothetical protein